MEVISAYIRKNGYLKVFRKKKTRPYRIGLAYSVLPGPLRKFLLKYVLLVRHFGAEGLARTITKKIRKAFAGGDDRFLMVDKSLRKVNSEMTIETREDDLSTAILRESR